MRHKLALAAVAAFLFFAGCASPSHTVAWEYRWITPVRQDFEKEINAAAKDGWEVVSVGHDTVSMSAVLRRPRK